MRYDMTKLEDLFIEVKDEQTLLLAYLADTSISLDDRWYSYGHAVHKKYLTANESYGDGYITLLGLDNPYDDLHMERHTTTDFYDILSYVDKPVLDDGQVTFWKEKVLASGYASFTFDW